MQKVIVRGKTMGDIKPVENISKNPQRSLPVQNKVLPSHKLQDHAY